MGPKNLAGTCASVPQKDLSWIDRVYMKLENMCVEVDKNPSILLQETSKYVESQMNVVGANVKKLCTELIQDLISPPILSSEGAEKKPECAVHCKCNCMDSEKTKQKGVDMIIKGSITKAGSPAKGFEEGEEGFENFVPQKQDILKEGETKVETRIIEIATQQQEFIVEGCPRKCEESGGELNNILGQDGAGYEEELNTAVRQEKMEALVQAHEQREYEEQLSLSKSSGRCWGSIGEEQGDSFGHFDAYNRNAEEGEHEAMIEEKVCRPEADLAEKASRPKENPCEELGSVERPTATHINNVAESTVTEHELRSQEITLHQKAVDFFHETRARASHGKMDANDAKFMYGSILSAKDMEAEEANETNEIGGDLRSMYSYVFSELSRSNQEEDSMIMSDFVIAEGHKDEEQSAHWFAGEDPRKALHTEDFSVDGPRQTECSVKEFDSDWELL